MAARKKKVTKKKVTKKKDDAVQTVQLKPLRLQNAALTIVGTSPLLQNSMSNKSKNQMREKKLGKNTKTREVLNIEAEAEAAAYRLSNGKHAMPVTAIKGSMVSAAHKDIGIDKVRVRKGLFIHADEGHLVAMKTPGYEISEDPARVANGRMDLRYRPRFDKWSVDLRIQYDMDLLQLDDIVNLLNRAGFGVGVGDWRVEKNGDYGRFKVTTTRKNR